MVSSVERSKGWGARVLTGNWEIVEAPFSISCFPTNRWAMAKTSRVCDRDLSPIEKYRPAKSSDAEDGRSQLCTDIQALGQLPRMSKPPGSEGAKLGPQSGEQRVPKVVEVPVQN